MPDPVKVIGVEISADEPGPVILAALTITGCSWLISLIRAVGIQVCSNPQIA
jgi:hypothetical protein